MPSHSRPARKRRAPTWRQHDPHDPNHWELQLLAELFLVLRKIVHKDATLDKWVMELELQGTRLWEQTPLKGKRVQTAQAEALRTLLSMLTPVQEAALLALEAMP